LRTGPTEPPTAETEVELKRLLAGAGLPVPAGRLAVSAEDAREVVRELGGAAVLKAVVPGILHKTELGAVAIGVQSEDAAATWERLRAFGGEVLVEELVEGGVEVLVGIAPSPLGPTLALGLGGIFAEAIGDATFRLLPVSRAEARSMVDDLGGKAVLHGARGRPPSDLDALAELLAGVSELADGWPDDVELDLNPVAVLPEGVRILDAALTRRGAH
jgi:acyl-CoA synthetase (NDP forming)